MSALSLHQWKRPPRSTSATITTSAFRCLLSTQLSQMPGRTSTKPKSNTQSKLSGCQGCVPHSFAKSANESGHRRASTVLSSSVGGTASDRDQRNLFQIRVMVLFVGGALRGGDLRNRSSGWRDAIEILRIDFVERRRVRQ